MNMNLNKSKLILYEMVIDLCVELSDNKWTKNHKRGKYMYFCL